MTLLATCLACQENRGADQGDTIPGYYSLSFTAAIPDTIRVQGVVRLAAISNGVYSGRLWVHAGAELFEGSPVPLQDIQRAPDQSLAFSIGSSDLQATLRLHPDDNTLWSGSVTSARFGRRSQWDATLAQRRSLLTGQYLLDLHYELPSGLGWDLGTLVLADTSPEHLTLSGTLESFLADTAGTIPYTRQRPPAEATALVSLAPTLSYSVDLPVAGAMAACTGTTVSPSGLYGHCAFDPAHRSRIPFTLWRIPPGWTAAERLRGDSDTLYLATYLRDRLSGCVYLTPRYATPRAKNGRASIPCFQVTGDDSRWSEYHFQNRRGAKLFALGFLGSRVLLDLGADTVLHAHEPSTTGQPKHLYTSRAGLRLVGGDHSAALILDLAGPLLRIEEGETITRLPPLPQPFTDSAIIQAAVHRPNLGTFVIAAQFVDTSFVITLLHYDGASWTQRRLPLSQLPDFDNTITRGDNVYVLQSHLRRLWTIDLRRQRLSSSRLGPAGPMSYGDDIQSTWGRLVMMDASPHIITDRGYGLYRVEGANMLVPVFALGFQTEQGFLPARLIIDGGREVLLDGATPLHPVNH